MLIVVCGLMFVCVFVVAIFPFRVIWCSCVLLLLDCCSCWCCLLYHKIADVVRICSALFWLVVRCVLLDVRCRCVWLIVRALLFVVVVC